jgi:hypothetical protein
MAAINRIDLLKEAVKFAEKAAQAQSFEGVNSFANISLAYSQAALALGQDAMYDPR